MPQVPRRRATTMLLPTLHPPKHWRTESLLRPKRRISSSSACTGVWSTRRGPTRNKIRRAHALIDAGADLILGHHPHVVQGLEVYKDRLIVYSMGDFVFDHYSRITGEAFVLQVSLPRDGTAPWGTIVPVYLSDSFGIPAVVTGNSAARILDRLTSLSAKRGLTLTRDGDIATFGAPPVGSDTGASGTTTTISGATTTTSKSGATTTTGSAPPPRPLRTDLQHHLERASDLLRVE